VKTFNYRTALSFAILMIFISTLAIFGYRQFSRDASLTAAYPGAPVTPNRQLSFQGRLENAAGTPIVGPTNMVFKLWNAVSAGTELYSTGTCTITSDSDGVFSTQIGGTCGAGITSSVFTENANVWLEVTVGAEVLAPRQPIASVAYALNSETLQGLPIGTTASTIPYINSSNTVSLTDANPKLTSTSGTFQISGPSLSFVTAAGSNGNITFAPDGTGQVNVNGNTTSTNFFNVSNAQLTTGSLITGTASNNNVGFKLIDLLSGSSPTSKFSVSDAGNTTIAGALTLSPLDCTSYANGGTLTTDGSGLVSCANDDGGGSSSNWKRVTGNLSPLISDDTISATTSAAIAMTLTQTGAFNALLVEDQASDSTPFVIDQSGNVGIGTSSPGYKLVVNSTTPSDQVIQSTNGATSGTNFAGVFNANGIGATTNTGLYTSASGATSNMGLIIDSVAASATNYALYSGAAAQSYFAGNVGVGVGLPVEKLQVHGTGAAPSLVTSSGILHISNDVTQALDFGAANSAPYAMWMQTKRTSNDGSSWPLAINPLGGNVGIGTMSPNHALDVNGNIGLAASSYINWGATDGTSGYGFRDNLGAMEFKNSGDPSWTAIGSGGGSFATLTGGTNVSAAMVVGSGASLTYTGGTVTSGVINANQLLGGTWAAPGAIGSTNPDSGVFTHLTSNGNTILGNATTDTITFGGRVALDSDLIPIGTAGTNDLGSAGLPWDNLFANSITLPTFTAGSVIFTGASGVLSQDNINFFFDDTNKRLGIGTLSPLATLDVRATLGTAPAASISGNTSQPTLVVDQSGVGDIFTANKSGDTKFVITNAGNVGIGVSAPTNKLEIGGSTSTISNAAGDITIDSASNNISFGGDSLINILNTYVSGELGIGVADAVSKLHVHGATDGKALAIFNELGDQDIFTASSSGTTRFRLTNDGSISLDGDYFNFGLTDGTAGYGVRDNAGVMEFKSLSGAWTAMGAGGASWWDQALGTLQPYNTTVDLLLGGTSTESAKIALININSGTPTASISAGIAGATYIKADGTIATTAKQTLSLGDATTTGNIILQGGNVGIGVASPTEKLEVNGYVVAQRFVDSSSATNYLDSANSATSLSILGDIINTDGTGEFKISSTTNQNIKIDAGSGTVIIGAAGAGKLDAGTVDPPYTINGEKFATYMAGMTGVKEETTGVIHASEYVSNIGYRATLDLATNSEGSDLWLFGKASNLKNNLDKLVVLLAGSSNTKTWYEIDAQTGKLYLYSLSPTTISYRLTAPRYDASTWANTRDESSTSIGHVIEDNTGWSVPPAIAALFNNTPVELVSPLASSSAITINNPIIIAPSEPSQEPALVVDGELDAATISARTAILQNIEADTITAKNIIADTIEANHIIGLDAKIASLSGMTDGEFETITDRIKARLAELAGNIPSAEDIPAPQEATASQTPSGTEGEVGLSVATSSATISSADIDFVTINNYLAVIGTATITTLDVTNGLYSETLNSKTGRLALADNTLVIDASGSVAINGDLTVSGRILADSAELNSLSLGTPNASSSSELGRLLSVYNEAGEAVATIDASGSANLASLTTNMITIASAPTATGSALAELLGTARSNSTAGESTLISPNTELTIESPYVTANSLVYLTPTGNTENKVVFVKSKNTCDPNLTPDTYNLQPSCTPSFTVGIDLPASSDISFNWWIIELAPPKIEDNP
jgi:hypothetical protein